MSLPSTASPARGHRPLLTIGFSLVIGLALGGFLFGVSQPVAPAWSAPAAPAGAAAVDADVLPSVPYAQMDSRTRGPNRAYRSNLATLVSQVPSLTGAVVNLPELRLATIARRAGRRAYDGAPPTIPHPVNDNDVATCTACHGEGREIAGRIAPRMSHKQYVNCTQCHAPVSNPGLGPAFPVENLFAGLASPGPGRRAWDGAPPLIPHRTQMRENCTACHGQLGLAGIRSTHPWRVNCLQCHPAAEDWAGQLFAVEGEIGRPDLPFLAPPSNP